MKVGQLLSIQFTVLMLSSTVQSLPSNVSHGVASDKSKAEFWGQRAKWWDLRPEWKSKCFRFWEQRTKISYLACQQRNKKLAAILIKERAKRKIKDQLLTKLLLDLLQLPATWGEPELWKLNFHPHACTYLQTSFKMHWSLYIGNHHKLKMKRRTILLFFSLNKYSINCTPKLKQSSQHKRDI